MVIRFKGRAQTKNVAPNEEVPVKEAVTEINNTAECKEVNVQKVKGIGIQGQCRIDSNLFWNQAYATKAFEEYF